MTSWICKFCYILLLFEVLRLKLLFICLFPDQPWAVYCLVIMLHGVCIMRASAGTLCNFARFEECCVSLYGVQLRTIILCSCWFFLLKLLCLRCFFELCMGSTLYIALQTVHRLLGKSVFIFNVKSILCSDLPLHYLFRPQEYDLQFSAVSQHLNLPLFGAYHLKWLLCY